MGKVQLNGGFEYKSFLKTDESFKILALLILNLSLNYTNEQIADLIIKWKDNVSMMYLIQTFDPERKIFATEIDNLVKSDGFKELLKQPVNVLGQLITDVIDSQGEIQIEVKKVKTIETSLDFDSTCIMLNATTK